MMVMISGVQRFLGGCSPKAPFCLASVAWVGGSRQKLSGFPHSAADPVKRESGEQGAVHEH